MEEVKKRVKGKQSQIGKIITKQQEQKFKSKYFNNDIKYKGLKYLFKRSGLYKEYKIKTNSFRETHIKY